MVVTTLAPFFLSSSPIDAIYNNLRTVTAAASVQHPFRSTAAAAAGAEVEQPSSSILHLSSIKLCICSTIRGSVVAVCALISCSSFPLFLILLLLLLI